MHRLTEEKATAVFEHQEAAMQLSEVQEELIVAQKAVSTVKAEAQANNSYLQEIEGAFTLSA